MFNLLKLVVSFVFPNQVFAAPPPDVDLDNNPLGGQRIEVPGNPLFQPPEGLSSVSGAAGGAVPLQALFSVILGFFTIVGGLLFLLYFVMGALTWISAGGDKGKVEKARGQLVDAAVGLIVVIVAQFIAGIVGGVLGLDILNPVNSLSKLF